MRMVCESLSRLNKKYKVLTDTTVNEPKQNLKLEQIIVPTLYLSKYCIGSRFPVQC